MLQVCTFFFWLIISQSVLQDISSGFVLFEGCKIHSFFAKKLKQDLISTSKVAVTSNDEHVAFWASMQEVSEKGVASFQNLPCPFQL